RAWVGAIRLLCSMLLGRLQTVIGWCSVQALTAVTVIARRAARLQTDAPFLVLAPSSLTQMTILPAAIHIPSFGRLAILLKPASQIIMSATCGCGSISIPSAKPSCGPLDCSSAEGREAEKRLAPVPDWRDLYPNSRTLAGGWASPRSQGVQPLSPAPFAE